MPDILQDFPIRASAARVFRAVSEPAELDQWWTVRSAGEPRVGASYDLFFGGRTFVRFHHIGWPSVSEHYRISSHCWAMYLRVLRRYLEHGERVPYEQRLDV